MNDITIMLENKDDDDEFIIPDNLFEDKDKDVLYYELID